MANSTYVIRIENGTSGGGDSPIAGNTSSSSSSSSGGNKKTYTQGQKNAQTALKALVAYDKFVKPFVDQAIQHQVSTIELRTGSAELQQKVEFGLGIAQSVGGILQGALAGYAVGNLPGALIGTLVSVGTTVMNYANQADKIRMQQSLENITLRGMNVRAGGYAPAYGASRMGRQ